MTCTTQVAVVITVDMMVAAALTLEVGMHTTEPANHSPEPKRGGPRSVH